MRVVFASDHAGYKMKNHLKDFVVSLGYEVEDMGAYDFEKEDDYPDFVSLAAKEVSQNPENTKAVVLGGSGQGEAIMANRFSNVRAVVYIGETERSKNNPDLDIIKLTREHNDANVLSLGARFLTEDEAENAVRKWLETSFPSDNRHFRRIEKIESLSEKYIQ